MESQVGAGRFLDDRALVEQAQSSGHRRHRHNPRIPHNRSGVTHGKDSQIIDRAKHEAGGIAQPVVGHVSVSVRQRLADLCLGQFLGQNMRYQIPERGLRQAKLQTTYEHAHVLDIDGSEADPGKRSRLSFRIPLGENLRVIVRTYGQELVREGTATTRQALYDLGIIGRVVQEALKVLVQLAIGLRIANRHAGHSIGRRIRAFGEPGQKAESTALDRFSIRSIIRQPQGVLPCF